MRGKPRCKLREYDLAIQLETGASLNMTSDPPLVSVERYEIYVFLETCGFLICKLLSDTVYLISFDFHSHRTGLILSGPDMKCQVS